MLDENTIQLFEEIERNGVTKATELIANGADVNAKDYKGRTPLYHLMAFGNVEIAKALIDHGADLEGVLLEHAAYGRGGAKMTKLLIDAGADVNDKTSGGYTPLLIAAGRGLTDVVRVLLESGVDVNAVGESQRKAKSLANSRGYPETAKLIEEYE
jgi:ankyrin repeat protein